MNQLFQGENLEILRRLEGKSIDLIYLDPPFASNTNYRVGTANNLKTAFVDTWKWTSATGESLREITSHNLPLGSLVESISNSLGRNDLAAYLVMMTERLSELHRVLKPSGSLYLHCDPSASSYLRVILDSIFGPGNFRNEIIWKRTSSHNDSKKWAHVHDTILFYAGNGFTWNPIHLTHDPEYIRKFYRFEDECGRYRLHEIVRTASMGPRPNLVYEYRGYTPEWGWRQVRGKVEALDNQGRLAWSSSGRPYLKRYLHEQKGAPCPGIWTDIVPLSHMAAERMGYPTQKPLTLLERIITASSNEGDVILDPFAGCGTSIHAAEKLGRQWIGIDVSELAIALVQERFKTAFPNAQYELTRTTPNEVVA
jgi:DNA modification methylase